MRPANDDPVRIGDHEVLAVLGEGGMGKVYLGRDSTGRYVAIKKMNERAKAGGPEYLSRFRKELEAVARIGADFTPPLRAFDLSPDDPWVAVDYVGSPTLRELITRLGKPLPLPSVTWLARAMVRALHELTDRGIIHRDLHPANLLVRAEGLLLIDFGLARDVSRPATAPYVPFGTRGYMAPEQRDDNEEQTHAVDVYALGASISFAATGKDPLTDLDFLVRRDTADNPLLPGLPTELRDLVHACMRKSWWKRPDLATLEQLIGDVRDTELEGTGGPFPSGALTVLREFAENPLCERSGVRWAAPAPGPSTSTTAAASLFPQVTGDGYLRAVACGGTLITAGLAGAVQRLNLRDRAVTWRCDIGGRVESRPAVQSGTLVVSGSNRLVRALDVDTGRILWTHDMGSTVGSAPRIVGRTVVLGDRAGGLRALDLGTSRTLWSTAAQHSIHACPTVIANMVVVGSWDHSMYAVDLASGEQRWSYATEGEIHESAVAADGRVLFGSGDHRLHALDARSGAPLWRFATGGPVHCEPAIYRGLVYFVSADGCLYSVHTATGAENWRALIPGTITSSPLLVAGRIHVGTMGAVHSVDASTGGRPHTRRIEGGAVVELVVTDDGRAVYAGTAWGHLVDLRADVANGPRS